MGPQAKKGKKKAEEPVIEVQEYNSTAYQENAVASITNGGTTYYYATLAQAVGDAQNDDTITLLSNDSGADTITKNKDLTLDLGAYTFTTTAGDGFIIDGAPMTVESSDGNGQVFHTGADDAFWTIQGGSLIVNSGKKVRNLCLCWFHHISCVGAFCRCCIGKSTCNAARIFASSNFAAVIAVIIGALRRTGCADNAAHIFSTGDKISVEAADNCNWLAGGVSITNNAANIRSVGSVDYCMVIARFNCNRTVNVSDNAADAASAVFYLRNLTIILTIGDCTVGSVCKTHHSAGFAITDFGALHRNLIVDSQELTAVHISHDASRIGRINTAAHS